MKNAIAVSLVVAALTYRPVTAADEVDPYIWLEEVEGSKALAWAKETKANNIIDALLRAGAK